MATTTPTATKRRSRQRPEQGTLPFRAHGGARKGAGRKPNRDRAGVPHGARTPLAARHPVHVTWKLRAGLPPLRRREERARLLVTFARGCDRFGFRLAHYAILNDHVHLVCEAADRTSLRRGLQGLAIRVARGLNALWRRRGKVFADRYHDRVLTSPREVRNVLRYVMGNARKHAAEGRLLAVPRAIDIYSSAPWFDGFHESFTIANLAAQPRPIADARTWLLRIGWRRLGLLSVHDLPASG